MYMLLGNTIFLAKGNKLSKCLHTFDMCVHFGNIYTHKFS